MYSITHERFEGDASPSPDAPFLFSSSDEIAPEWNASIEEEDNVFLESDDDAMNMFLDERFASMTNEKVTSDEGNVQEEEPRESLQPDDDDGIGFLNERFASFPDGESTVFVGLGDVDSGMGDHVTKIYSGETLKETVLESFPRFDGEVLEKWMATPELRNHYPGGVSFNQSPYEPLEGRLYLPVNVDEEMLSSCEEEYGQLFWRMLTTKARHVNQGFAGVPTILVVNPRFAEETFQAVVHDFKSIFGDAVVGSGMTNPSPTDLIHVLPPEWEDRSSSTKRKMLRASVPTYTWRIMVVTNMSQLPIVLPPKMCAHPRLLVISKVNDWETNYANQVRFNALSPKGRRVLRALSRDSWPTHSGTAKVSDLARRLGYSTDEVDHLAIALITFVGATMVSYGHGTMTIPGRATARRIFCEETGMSDSVFKHT